MCHAAGDMHPPTSVHEMRAAPGTKNWTKGRTAGCPDLILDDRLRLPCRSSRQHTGIRKRRAETRSEDVSRCRRHAEMRAAPGTKSRTKGRTAGCPALKLDDRLRLP